MGMFDVVTDAFTGRPGKEAAEKTQGFITSQQSALDAALAQARGGGLAALESGRTGALGAVDPRIAQARLDLSGMTPQAIAALYGGQDLGAGALTGAQDPALAAIQGGVATATGAYAPLAAAGARYGGEATGTAGASADALGLNGPEGVARAQAAFQAGPGYQFQLGQGIESLSRAANVGGMVASGNTFTEAQRFGSGLAAQEWDKYRTALAQREGAYTGAESGALGAVGAGISQAGLTGGTAGANVLTGTGGRLSDLYSTTGGRAADVYGREGTSLADLESKAAGLESGIWTGTAQQQADLLARLAGVQGTFMGQTLKPYGDAAAMQATAEQGGSKNLWDFGMNTAKMFMPKAGASSVPTPA